jgi:hypothetical protein
VIPGAGLVEQITTTSIDAKKQREQTKGQKSFNNHSLLLKIPNVLVPKTPTPPAPKKTILHPLSSKLTPAKKKIFEYVRIIMHFRAHFSKSQKLKTPS